MKLLSLDLSAFGPFTGTRLDFSKGHHGLHVVYGPNEAGKSSALRAITGLLYGIPPQTSDNFIHAHKDLRISACISDSNGNELCFTRRKGLKNTLLSENGDPIPDHVLDVCLHGITREVFTTMYGLDRHELTLGGRALIEGQGDLGESLFAAGMGIAGMRGMMRAIEEEAGELFKPNAKNPAINTLIRDFRQLKKHQAATSLSAGEWTAHESALRQVELEKRSVMDQWQKQSAAYEHLKRLRTAIPKIVNLTRLQQEIRALGTTVMLSPDFSDDRKQTELNLGQARAALTRLEKDLEEIRKEAGAISLSPPLIQAQDDITQLFQRSGSYKKAMQDLPRIKADYKRQQTAITHIRDRLGPSLISEDTALPRLKNSQIARIRELGREPALLKEREKVIRRKIAGLTLNLEKKQDKLKTFSDKKDTGRLEAILGDIRRHGDPTDMLSKSILDMEARQAEADLELKRLGLWQGSLEALESCPLPEDITVEKYETRINELKDQLHKTANERTELENRLLDLSEKIDTLTQVEHIPDIQDLAAARAYRDKGWQLVRTAWDDHVIDGPTVRTFDPSAENIFDAYEKSVQKADDISDRLRDESDRVALLENYKKDRTSCRLKKTGLDKLLAETQKTLTRTEEEWQDLWRLQGMTPLSPREMFPWLRKARHILSLAQELRQKKTDIKQLKHQVQEQLAILKKCLTDTGGKCQQDENADLPDLILKCEQHVKYIEKENQEQETCTTEIETLEQELAGANTDLEQTLRELKTWQTNWEQALKPLGLKADALPAEVDVVLDGLQQIAEHQDKRAAMDTQIKDIEIDAREFEEEIRSLCRRIGKNHADTPPVEVSAILYDHLKTALTNAARFQTLEKQEKAKIHLIREAQRKVEEMTARLTEMCKQAGASGPEDLPDIERRSFRAFELEQQISEITTELTQYSAGTPFKEFLAEAESTDADQLPSKIKTLEQELAVLEEKRSALDQDIGRKQEVLKAMDGRDEAADIAGKLQSNLAELRDTVERFASLKIAAVILKNGIEQYRETHKGPVLKRAGDMFSRLTLGSFKGLVPDYDEKDTPVLMGLRPLDDKVPVSGMSEGTCDQLYLSLRLASLEHHLDSSTPFPFILDDILVNFDNDRSAACLKILSRLSEKTQILFFTHHQHLVDLARDHVDEAILFEHRL